MSKSTPTTERFDTTRWIYNKGIRKNMEDEECSEKRLKNIDDGAGCAEVWEKLSKRRKESE